MIRRREVRRMAAILCMITGMTAVPAYAAALETFGAVPGWNQISGKWYYLMENGAWSTDFIEDENTCYTFTKDGTLSYARKTPNTQGGAYPVYVLDQKEQELFDDMNDEKSDLFFDTYPEAEDDYDNGDAPHLSSTWISAISQRQDFLPLWKRDIPRAKIRSREREP